MEKFAFVVLNYQSTDETVKYIESILKIKYENKYIVVVDNDSDNQKEFFVCLKNTFQDVDNITYLKNFKNLGYNLLYSSELITEHEGKSLINIEKDSLKRQMQVSKVGAYSCMVEARIFLHKKNQRYLRQCLTPDTPEYCEV